MSALDHLRAARAALLAAAEELAAPRPGMAEALRTAADALEPRLGALLAECWCDGDQHPDGCEAAAEEASRLAAMDSACRRECAAISEGIRDGRIERARARSRSRVGVRR